MGRPKKGQSRRVSVMDRFNLPDLTEFISTIAVLVRGCETGRAAAWFASSYFVIALFPTLINLSGARRDAPPSPTRIEPLLPMPARERAELFDKTFFSS